MHGQSWDLTLSNAAEIVFLAAMVPVLLRVNHERDGRPEDGRTAGRTAGRPDSDDGNRGKATYGCVSPKNAESEAPGSLGGQRRSIEKKLSSNLDLKNNNDESFLISS